MFPPDTRAETTLGERIFPHGMECLSSWSVFLLRTTFMPNYTKPLSMEQRLDFH